MPLWTALDFAIDNTTAEKSLVCLATTPLTNSRDDLCEKCELDATPGVLRCDPAFDVGQNNVGDFG